MAGRSSRAIYNESARDGVELGQIFEGNFCNIVCAVFGGGWWLIFDSGRRSFLLLSNPDT